MLCATMPDRALEGVTVVECGVTGAAAYGAKLLADLGADVIKVEPPGDWRPGARSGAVPERAANPDASADVPLPEHQQAGRNAGHP